MAISGKSDSTLIVVLQQKLDDSAVAKNRPHLCHPILTARVNFISGILRPDPKPFTH